MRGSCHQRILVPSLFPRLTDVMQRKARNWQFISGKAAGEVREPDAALLAEAEMQALHDA